MSTGAYAKTAGDLIREALRAATISGIALQVDPADFATAHSALNDILGNLQTKQIHIWSESEALLPLNPNQQTYSLSDDPFFSSYAATTASAALAGATSISVVSTIGMSATDKIGIELSDGTRQWSVIDSVDSLTGLVMIEALTADVPEGATVYTYAAPEDQPVRITSVRYADSLDADEISTTQVSRDEYYNQPTKSATGAVNTWYFSRQLQNGLLSIWPVADSCRRLLRFTFIRPQYIPEDQTDDMQVPPEWYLPLKWLLAADLALTYGVDPNKQMVMEQKAQQYMRDALESDSDFSGFQFHPGCR